ncbi:MAG: hypothetical protein JST54_04700, partial [Deltaproteobacteria bacterium]|nr:hypothetical protein [Deltaproteobacteria bacterium]
MASPDGRAPPMPSAPADKPGEVLAPSEDEGTAKNDLSGFRKERAEAGLSSQPTPRRPTSGVPAQRDPDTAANAQVRPRSGERPRTDSQTDGEANAASAAPTEPPARKPTGAIPVQRGPTPPAQPRRATTGLNLPKKPSLLEASTDAGVRSQLSPAERAALDAAAEVGKAKRAGRVDTAADPDDADSDTGPSLPLPRGREATPTEDPPEPVRVDGTRVDQGPLPDPH